jgi:hypothetical protein
VVRLNIKTFKIVFSWLLGLFLFALAVWMAFTEYSDVWGIKTLPILFFGMFISALSFWIQGFELSWLLKREEVAIKRTDRLTLPFSMNVWGYLIPFQGSFLYFLSFIKSKYNVSFFSLTGAYFWLFFLGLSVDGMMGLILLVQFQASPFLILLLLGMASSVFAMQALARINPFREVDDAPSWKKKWVQRLHLGLNGFSQFKAADYLRFTGISVLLTGLTSLWGWHISQVFNLGIDLTGVFYATVLMRIGLLLKITPGNLGVLQLGSGAVFSALGYSASAGIFISVWQQASMLLVSIPIGLLGTWLNRDHFSWKSLFSSTRP